MTDPGSKQPVKVGASHRLQAWLPGLTQFRGYRREWLRRDILAGVDRRGLSVPQVMAYAEVAGLPPVAGLWAILAPLASTRCSARPGSCRSGPNPPPR